MVVSLMNCRDLTQTLYTISNAGAFLLLTSFTT